MAKTIYLVRHGQTLYNLKKRIQGHVDSPLTEKGKQQALEVKHYFEENHIQFDACYCSTSERASDTLEIITNQPYTRLKGLKEWNFGIFEGESEDLHPPKPPEQLHHSTFFVQYGGESDSDVQKRVVAAMNEIAERDGDQILVISHAGAIKMFMYHVYHDPQQKPIMLSNCTIVKLTYDNQKFDIVDVIKPLSE